MTPRIDGARRVPWEFFAPCVFLFILPITHTTPLRVTCLVLSVATTLLAARRREAAAPPTMATIAAIVAWAAVAIVAAATSIEPDYSWGEFRNEVVSPLAAFLVFHFLTSDARVWHIWRHVLVLSLAVASTIGVVTYLGGGDWSRDGFVGDRNAMSTYVVLMMPFVMLTWLQAESRSMRAAVALTGSLALVAAALTQNRNIWFAIAFEAVVFAVLVWRREPTTTRRTLAIRFVVAGFVGAVLLGATLTYVIREKAAISNLSVESQARFDRDPRFAIWSYAAERIGERPWTGYGYGRGILRKDFRERFDDRLKWHAHNMFLNELLESGVVGGLVLIALFVALLRQATVVYRVPDADVWPLGAWIITMIAGILLKVMTDDVLIRENSLLFWSALGMAFGRGLRATKEPA